MHRLLHKHMKGMSLLHLIVLDSLSSQQTEIESRQLDCLKAVQEFNPKMYSSLLSKNDRNQITPLLAAIREGNGNVSMLVFFNKYPDRHTYLLLNSRLEYLELPTRKYEVRNELKIFLRAWKDSITSFIICFGQQFAVFHRRFQPLAKVWY